MNFFMLKVLNFEHHILGSLAYCYKTFLTIFAQRGGDIFTVFFLRCTICKEKKYLFGLFVRYFYLSIYNQL